MVKLRKSIYKSIFNSKTLWEEYQKKLYKQAKFLSWDKVWLGEHSQRGILLHSLQCLVGNKKEYFIEVPANERNRADLVVCSAAHTISEIVEIKQDDGRFWELSCKNSCRKALNAHYNSKYKSQASKYQRMFEKNGIEKVKCNTLLVFSKIVFNLNELKPDRVSVSDVEEKYASFSKNVLSYFPDEFKNKNCGFCFIPIELEMLKLCSKKSIDELKSPYFMAKKNKGKKIVKLFGGVLVSWQHKLKNKDWGEC